VADIPSHEGAEGSPAVKVGVLLDREPDEIGEWLADAAAFDAGGADALWIDPGPEWDVLALTAALAVITFRARLVVALPSSSASFGASSSAAGLARTLDTVGRLSHGRLDLIADPGQRDALDVIEPSSGVFRRVPGEPGVFESVRAGAGVQRWVSVPVPEGRVSWRAAREDAAGRGALGLVVPADPRLLDILRNPDDPGERRDLRLAQGLTREPAT
jgi:hypothetical protein